jgi:hypothetical protein
VGVYLKNVLIVLYYKFIKKWLVILQQYFELKKVYEDPNTEITRANIIGESFKEWI